MRGVRRRQLRGDRGAVGTLLVLSAAAVLAVAGGCLAALASVGVARHRAATVADLSALAAAERVLQGPGQACAAARRTAEAAGGRVTACRVAGDDVTVDAQVRPEGWLGTLGAATARARAGPAVRPAAPVAGGPVALGPTAAGPGISARA